MRVLISTKGRRYRGRTIEVLCGMTRQLVKELRTRQPIDVSEDQGKLLIHRGLAVEEKPEPSEAPAKTTNPKAPGSKDKASQPKGE